MRCEIISIGDELLIGQVINTNAAWMAQELNKIGVAVMQMTVASDSPVHITKSIRAAMQHSDVVIITGGLGPTRDDLTTLTLARYFGVEMVLHQPTLDHISSFFRMRGKTLTELNRKQAELPANCIPLPNPHGTAPGMWFEADNKVLVALPGVPFEMKPLMTDHVLPRLISLGGGPVIRHKTILTQGVGESFLSEMISTWEDALPANIKLAYLPQPGIVRLRLSATGADSAILEKELDDWAKKLVSIIPDLVFGFDDETLESVVGNLLREKGQKLVTAESCTGGYLAHLITSVAGSSDYYKGSVIAYDNRLKTQLLSVPEELLAEAGAVSQQVAEQMALTARLHLEADWALALTGIAGPGRGSEEKPVGTVWIALAGLGYLESKVFYFGDQRDRNIRRAALSALNMLRLTIVKGRQASA